MVETKPIERLPVNEAFALPAGTEALDRAAEGLTRRGFDVKRARTGDEARDIVLAWLPDGAEVGQGASETLAEIGVTQEIEESGKCDAIRPRTRAMDRATQGREIRKLGSAPDYFVNSAQAITENGEIVIASNTGSQIGPIASGAGKVILVVGSQKVVPDLATAARRIDEYSYPLEDARFQQLFGRRSAVRKELLLRGEFFPGRITVVLVNEPVGV